MALESIFRVFWKFFQNCVALTDTRHELVAAYFTESRGKLAPLNHTTSSTPKSAMLRQRQIC